ncbi:hypothetical protein ACP70R_044039 [Stipagrostis hirtigluma subsp. patula]
MQAPCVNLTEAARSVQLFKINGHSATKEKPAGSSIASARTTVGGYDWVIDYHPFVNYSSEHWIKVTVTLASDASGVVASFAFRVVDQTGRLGPSPEAAGSATLSKGQSRWYLVMSRNKLASSGYVKDDSFLVECVITVLLEKPKEAAAAAVANVAPSVAAAAASSDMQRHFGELFRSQKGTDVTFLVAGERVAAHRCVLAARSPVFMAELFGDMKEKGSPHVEIEDMEADVFRALIWFIYTDTSPEELDSHEVDAKTMAQHLLAAADRYGMERLKLICEEKVCADISVDNVATALALAEQHGCPKLKARCMEFAVATPANLRAVVATKGYKHLMASCPSVMSELLVSVVDRYK